MLNEGSWSLENYLDALIDRFGIYRVHNLWNDKILKAYLIIWYKCDSKYDGSIILV